MLFMPVKMAFLIETLDKYEQRAQYPSGFFITSKSIIMKQLSRLAMHQPISPILMT